MDTFQVDAVIITFKFLVDGARTERAAAVTVRHMPAGNVTYIDNGGLQEPTLRCRGYLYSYADLVALQALCGQQGTLTYSEDVYTATLLSCSQSRAMGVTGDRFVDLDFVIATI